MICKNCKREILDRSKFCGYCGKEVKAEFDEVKEINNNKKDVFKFKIVLPVCALLIIGIVFINNKANIDNNKQNDDINNPIEDIVDNNQSEGIQNNRDKLISYISSFDNWAYFPGGYLYIIENGLIKICLDGEVIYEEEAINEGVWYTEENEDLLNLDVDYWIKGDSKDTVIKYLIGKMQDSEGSLSYDENLDRYAMYFEYMTLYYSPSDNCFSIYSNPYEGTPEIMYEYNLNTKEEFWGDGVIFEADYINREISYIIGCSILDI